MKRTTQAIASAIAALAAMGLSGGAAAQQTWNYGTVTGGCDVPNPPSGCAPVPGGSGSSAAATVYGFSSSGANFLLGATGTNGIGVSTYSGLTNQGGSGLGSTGLGETGAAPDHAFDSRTVGSTSYGTATTEMLLINFNSKVDLTAIALGWANTDSDISILRWDGSGSAIGTNGNAGKLVDKLGTTALSGTGTGTNGLTSTSSGWTLVSSRDMDNTATTCSTVGGCDLGGSSWNITGNGGKVSSWWMISTYFGGTAGSNGQTLDIGNDFFKILSFTGNVCQYSSTSSNGGLCTKPPENSPVPEPTSLALVSIALAGAVGVRRRRNQIRG